MCICTLFAGNKGTKTGLPTETIRHSGSVRPCKEQRARAIDVGGLGRPAVASVHKSAVFRTATRVESGKSAFRLLLLHRMLYLVTCLRSQFSFYETSYNLPV